MASNELLFENLHQRGFINQSTNESGLIEAILKHQQENKPFAVYIGVDPTASSLHIGHTLPLYMLKHLASIGLKPIILVGGGTGRIGDPSGKTQSRQLLDEASIAYNIEQITLQCRQFFGEESEVQIVNNADWLNNLHYIDFLRNIGRHFSVNRMLSFETYASRLESGLTFLEFNYQLLQSYDFAELFIKHHCKLQIGGQDQWANIISGVDLIRRLHGEESFGLTCPLIMTSSGQKMGKSEQGAIYLDAKLTSPINFYQYWRNCSDADVARFLKLFTFLSLEECAGLTNSTDAQQLNLAKERLAYETTKIIHGEEIANEVRQQVKNLFARPQESETESDRLARVAAIIASFSSSSSNDRTQQQASSGGLTHLTLSLEDLTSQLTLADLFVRTELASSKSEFRKKLVAANAAFCNEVAIEDADQLLSLALFQSDSLLLRAGKKRYALCSLASDNDRTSLS